MCIYVFGSHVINRIIYSQPVQNKPVLFTFNPIMTVWSYAIGWIIIDVLNCGQY